MTEPVLLGSGEGATVNMGAMGQGWTKLGSKQTDDTFGAWEFSMRGAMAAPPPHVHDEIHELMVLLDGEAEFIVGDQTRKASAGAFVYAPPGIVHGIVPTPDTDIRALIITSPGSKHEAVIEAMEKMAASGGPPDPQKLAEFFADVDMRMAEGAP
jgi:mannose-6-phosphate isomerase-like protein (cupin superfamily)